jgi:hypothetical protein
MALAALGFVWMAQWDMTSLLHPGVTVPLVLGGLGFGLALAPVNAALLASTASDVHGVVAALVVVARMVGMLVGISVLTTLGLRRYFEAQQALPAVTKVCGGRSRCNAYSALLDHAVLTQVHTIFLGAAGCAVVAGLVALVLFRGAATRGTSTAELMRTAG